MILGFLYSFFSAIASWFPWKRKQTFKSQSTFYHVNDFHFPGNESHGSGYRNKAYADQRQKARHNRRRKPNKHMRNLYKLRAIR